MKTEANSIYIAPSCYQDSGETYYLFMWSNTEPAGYISMQVDTNGNVLADQTPIAVELNGGTLTPAAPTSLDSGVYTPDAIATELGTPTKTGYKFKGWSTESMTQLHLQMVRQMRIPMQSQRLLPKLKTIRQPQQIWIWVHGQSIKLIIQ